MDPRWRRRVVLLGLVSMAVVVVGTVPQVHGWVARDVLVLVVGLAAWLVELVATPRARWAEAALLLVVGAAGAALNTRAPDSPGFVLAYFAVAGLGLRFPLRRAAAWAAVVVVTVDAGMLATSHHVTTSVTTSDLGLAFVFAVAAATRNARAADARSRSLVAELQESRAAQAAAAALAERARLAREIHDILAHSLSGQVMSLEATRLLAERTGADPRVVAEISRAHHLARSGLADTRRAIGALRGDSLPGAELVGELVDQARTMQGLRATLTVRGTAHALPAEAGLCLYRTAQEALTNTAKHAGRGATVELELTWHEDRVTLTATDQRRDPPGSAPSRQLPASGYGLTGLRERAELAGGTLDAAATETGFAVRLTLPFRSPSDAARGEL